MICPSVVQTYNSIGNDSLNIYHRIEKSARNCIDPMANPYQFATFLCPHYFLIIGLVRELCGGYDSTLRGGLMHNLIHTYAL